MVNERAVTDESRRDVARKASRARILDAALSLFADRGFDGTSVRRIAEEAGVSHGLLYAHFESKEDLLRELMELSLGDIGLSLDAGAGEGSAGDRLHRLAREGARLVRENLAVWRLSYAIRMQPAVLKTMAPLFAEWTGRVLGQLHALFSEAGMEEPAAEAELFFAAFDGLCQHFTLNPADYPLEDRARRLVDLWVARMPSPQSPRAERSDRR